MTKAVGGYIRVSTQGQVRDGYSLAYQRDEVIRHCVHNGIKLVQIYEDKGSSVAQVHEEGLTVEREGLQSMLADHVYSEQRNSDERVINSAASNLWLQRR